jgi:hypothetical protein
MHGAESGLGRGRSTDADAEGNGKRGVRKHQHELVADLLDDLAVAAVSERLPQPLLRATR